MAERPKWVKNVVEATPNLALFVLTACALPMPENPLIQDSSKPSLINYDVNSLRPELADPIPSSIANPIPEDFTPYFRSVLEAGFFSSWADQRVSAGSRIFAMDYQDPEAFSGYVLPEEGMKARLQPSITGELYRYGFPWPRQGTVLRWGQEVYETTIDGIDNTWILVRQRLSGYDYTDENGVKHEQLISGWVARRIGSEEFIQVTSTPETEAVPFEWKS